MKVALWVCGGGRASDGVFLSYQQANYFFRVPIDGSVWHLDVGLSFPRVGEDPKGLAVRQLKWYMSWV